MNVCIYNFVAMRPDIQIIQLRRYVDFFENKIELSTLWANCQLWSNKSYQCDSEQYFFPDTCSLC